METIRYYSKIAGSRVIMPDGFVMQFLNGFYDLKESDYVDEIVEIPVMNSNPADKRAGRHKFEVYKAELEIMVKMGPLLYKEGIQPVKTPPVRDSRGRQGADKNALSEIELNQQNAALRGVKGRETGDANTGLPGATIVGAANVNESTVDTELQAAVLAVKEETPTMKAARERIEMAQKTAAAGAQGGMASGTSTKVN